MRPRLFAARRSSAAVSGALLPLLLVGAPLRAQTSLGQQFMVPDAPNTVLQLLSVGPRGLVGSGPNVFTASIYAYSGTGLVGPTLFSQTLGSSFAGFTLTPNIELTADSWYALVVTSVGGSLNSLADNNSYRSGAVISCLGQSGCAQSADGSDLSGLVLQFGPTAVIPTADSTVPEPSTWALLGTGLLGMVGVARRKRRRDAR